MLLEPLVSVLAEVKERLQRHNQELRQSEALTRSALIDPVLRALGWNTENPALVWPECPVSGGKADYALLSPDNKVVAIVEVKSLGQSLEQGREIDQLLRYAFADGIPYGVLTNGNNWYAYDLKTFGAMQERRVLEITIADAEPYRCALQLLYLWRPNLASGQPAPANVPPRPVAVPIAPPTPAYAPPEPPPAAAIHMADVPLPGTWTPLARVTRASRDDNLQAIRFPGGESRQIKSWANALVQATDWLVGNEYFSARHCPLPGLGFVNSQPISARGITFRRYQLVSGGIYVNFNQNAGLIATNMRKLLNHFRISPEDVGLRFE